MRSAAGFFIAATIAMVAACGGDEDDAPSETLGNVTPVGTKEPTPPPSDADGAPGEAPAPVEPELDEELVEVTRGDREATIEPGGVYALDPVAVAAEAGQSAECENLQFDFSWQVTDPFPADGVVLSWQFTRDGSRFEVAGGPAGNQAVGCGTLEAENQGSAPFTLAIRYLIGALP